MILSASPKLASKQPLKIEVRKLQNNLTIQGRTELSMIVKSTARHTGCGFLDSLSAYVLPLDSRPSNSSP